MQNTDKNDPRLHHGTDVTIVEVGPRDGLQNEAVFFPTDQKVKLIDLLSESGLTRIEATSFVHPDTIPALRDAEAIFKGIQKKPGIVYSALTPNLAGCKRAVQTAVDELALFVSASETHNQKNVGMSVAESIKGFAAVAKTALKAGKSLRGYVATAFGCIDEGRIPIARIKDIIKAYVDLGVTEAAVCDTFGMANPRLTKDFFDELNSDPPKVPVAAHFHDNRGLGLANVCAAYDKGVRIFDSAIGGLGGCPTAKTAAGNIATEDIVNMLEEMGLATGVNFDKLMPASALIEKVLGVGLPSHTYHQGRPVWQMKRRRVSK